MGINIDDDVLFQDTAWSVQYLDQSDDGLRKLRNMLVGDRHRKEQFLSGGGITHLLSILSEKCNDDKHLSLQYAAEALTSIAFQKEAAVRLHQLGVCNAVRNVISSVAISSETTLSLLKLLERTIEAAEAKLELPRAELFRLVFTENFQIARLALSLLSRAFPLDSDHQVIAVLQFVSSQIDVLPPFPLPYLDFLLESLRYVPALCVNCYNTRALSYYLMHTDRDVRLRAAQCVALAPVSVSISGSEMKQLDLQCLSMLELCLYSSQNYDCVCSAFAAVFERCPSFPVNIQKVLPHLFLNVSSSNPGPTLALLAALASASEPIRVRIASSASVLTAIQVLKSSDFDARQAASSLFKSLSRSVRVVRLQLLSTNVMKSLFECLHESAECARYSTKQPISGTSIYQENSDLLRLAATITAAIANLLIEFGSLPKNQVSSENILLLVSGTCSFCQEVRLYSTWALKNLLFKPDITIFTSVTQCLSVQALQNLLKAESVGIQLQAVGLLRNVFHPNTSGTISTADVIALGGCIGDLMHSSNDFIILECLTALVNMSSGNRAHKFAVMQCGMIIERAQNCLDHPWPEIRLSAIMVFENLFCRTCIFRKRRTKEHALIEALLTTGLKHKIMLLLERETSNYDIEARAAKVIICIEKCLHVLMDLKKQFS
uniref:Armadillo repeat-containing protein 8 n=1 Tax=Spongospora subterranea TaxID=70186 RepID=A0A0H5R934_9EUKA|eukprot:CRZ10640.1 hypothetical protein [Spongospora subterranea]